ncbi:MAG: hypothetical protein LBK25_03075, partial [Treponema sp.]|nr:hypothetical protein [Treponema sp.]
MFFNTKKSAANNPSEPNQGKERIRQISKDIETEVHSLYSSVMELSDAVGGSIQSFAGMDKITLSLVSKAINHVISVADIMKATKRISDVINTLDGRMESQAAAVTETSAS